MKRIIICALVCLALAGCSTANASQQDAQDAQASRTLLAVAHDKPIPAHVINHDSVEAQAAAIVDNGEAADEEPEPLSDADTQDIDYELQESDYDAAYSVSGGSEGIYHAEYSDAYNTDGPSYEMPGWYDGYLETYYNASQHYLASTWSVDEEGFYRDENGRYVIGVEISHADEMPYGTVVQTGKGEGVVYDYGSGAEVHDFATVW